MDKKVFITYSWDSAAHKNWVKGLADRLIQNGIEVRLDQYDLQPGESFTHFMEVSIAKTDRVLVILTPQNLNPLKRLDRCRLILFGNFLYHQSP
jgi:hypothetical protein